LPWRQREIAFEKAFPQHLQSILVVVDAPTPELSSQATAALFEKLSANKDAFKSVTQPGGGEFFRRNGLLFLSTAETEKIAGQLTEAEPLIAQLATDPSLRGLVEVLQMGLTGVELNKITLDAMVRPLTATAETVEGVLAKKPVTFSWQELMSGGSQPNEKRKFIDVQPVLDYTALEPGKKATDAIRKTASDLNLAGDYHARVRLTGPVPIADEEFSTVQEGMLVNGLGTVVIVLVILWLALKSGKIILAVSINLVIGLAVTAALGFLVVGPLNLISIAFAVLFVGLGVDFGIQFSVRYRAERFELDDLKGALALAASGAQVLVHYGHGANEADSVVAEIRKAGGRADAIATDLAAADGASKLARQARSIVGDRLDILVVNAGVLKVATIEETTVEDFDRLFAINVRTPFFLVQQLLPIMSKGSSIVFLSSLAASAVVGTEPAYAATKGAIDTLVKHFASILGARGIRVNAVAPGVVETDMLNFTKTAAGRDLALGMQALKRLAQPDDIGGVIAFLASEDARWITGDTIRVDGGSKL